jgi:Zn-dependent peptidase ImmA (M78 family)
MSVAAELRTSAGFKHPPYSARNLLKTCFPDILVTGEKLPRRVAEIVHVIDGKRTILYNRSHSPPEHRVSVLHGLAHIIFDSGAERLQCSLPTGPQRHRAPAEVRADLFAAEVLTPFAELDAFFRGEKLFPRDPIARRHFDDTVDGAASHFNVSVIFMRWRVRDLAHLRRTSFKVAHSPNI